MPALMTNAPAAKETPMQVRGFVVTTSFVLAALVPCASLAAIEVLKEEPPKNALPRGKVVYVDDGTCPAGEVKEVTGGNQEKGIARKVRCVKRPN
jgi:hypothetical protein